MFGNSYIPCLLLIITIRFSCSDTKTLPNIKMSQNITTRIVWKIFFCFLCLNKQLQLLKTVILLAEIYFIFLENVIHQTSKAFNTKFGPQWKDRKSRSQVKEMFALSCKLVALILGQNCIKVLRVTKIVKQAKFQRAWWRVKAKYCLRRKSWSKYLRQTAVFLWNSTLREKFNFYFSTIYC